MTKASKVETSSSALKKREVWVGSLRIWSDQTIGNEPYDKASEEYKVWTFFQKFVGEDQTRKIESIVVYGDTDGEECDCGAETDGGRLTKPCVCKGGGAVITFKSEAAALSLKQQIKNHKGYHENGVQLVEDGRIVVCEDCCFNKRQVRAVNKKPGPSVDSKPYLVGEEMVNLDQSEGITSLIVGVLGARAVSLSRTLSAQCTGKSLETAWETLESEVNKFVKDHGTVYPDREEVINSLKQGWLIILEGTEACSVKVAEFFEQVTKLNKGITEAEKKKNKNQSDEDKAAKTTDEDNSVRDEKEVSKTKFDPTEENCKKFLKRLEKALEENSVEEITKIKGIVVLEGISEELAKRYQVISDIFANDEITDDVENGYEARWTAAKKKYRVVMAAVTDRMELERLRKSPPKGRTEYSKSSVPENTEIDHQVSLFKEYVTSFKEGVDDVEKVVFDDDVETMKLDVLAVKKDMEPGITSILKSIGEIADKSREWLKSDESELDAGRRSQLEKCVKEYQKFQHDWQKLKLEIARIDRKYHFSRETYDKLAAGIVKNQKVEVFWNQEGGRKFQNLLEWFKQLEMKILTHFPQAEQKIEQVIAHLSPKIGSIIRVQNFKTYEALKKWLIREYLDEDQILDQWQSEISNVKVTNLSDVPVYVSQIKGVIKQIQSCATGKDKLGKKLYSQENIALLIRNILTPLGKATGKDQYGYFMEFDWAPIAAKNEEKGTDIDPEEMFRKMEERLEVIKQVSRTRVTADKDSEHRLRQNFGTSKEGKKMALLYQKALSNGADDPFSWALKNMSNKEEAPGKKKEINKDSGKDTPSGKKNTMVVVKVTQNDNFYAYQVIPANNRKKSEKFPKGQVLVNQESLQKAKEWENNDLTFRCWVCTKTNPHEFTECGKALSATNKERLEAAKNVNQGPGLQCFSCLKSTCFIERCLSVPSDPTNKVRKKLPHCKADTRNIGCFACTVDIRDDPNRKGQKPMHATICIASDHLERINKEITVNKLAKVYGENIKRIEIHIYSLPLRVVPGIKNPSHQNNNEECHKNKGGKLKKSGKETKEEKDKWDSIFPPEWPELPRVAENEYKGASDSVLHETDKGDTFLFDQKVKENKDLIVNEPNGVPVYFMQQLNLRQKNTLLFYDSGAMMNLITTELARELNLKMTERHGMYLIGAGNALTVTQDGKYELLLGKGANGEIYKVVVAGMEELTGPMMQANFEAVHQEVRELGKNMFANRNGGMSLDPDEKLPSMVGGCQVKIIIGLSLPALQPRIMFHLPGGLLVARARLKDIWGSTVVFGGVYDHMDAFYKASYLHLMGPGEVDRVRKYNRFCYTQYVQFRDSLRQDHIFLGEKTRNNGNVSAWNEVIEEDTDEQAVENPLIIAGSEEKRSSQMQRAEIIRSLMLEGERFVFDKYKKSVNCVEKKEEIPLKKKKVKWSDKKINTYVYNKECVTSTMGQNVLYSGDFKEKGGGRIPGSRDQDIENTVDQVFGGPYEKGACGAPFECIPEGEAVVFENEEDRKACFAAIEKNTELDDLIEKETGLKVQGCVSAGATLGLRGFDAYNAATGRVSIGAPLGQISAEPQQLDLEKKKFSSDLPKENHSCKTCNCSSKDADLIFGEIEESEVVNIDAKGFSKLRQALRRWEDEDATGTGVDYRCSKCASCKECLKSGKTRARSVREEDEQAVIESSVRIDWEKKVCYVYLPWIKSPQELAIRWGADSNIKQAKHFLRKMLQKSERDRKSLVEFWEELKSRNVVCRLKDLDERVQKSIADAPVKHIYPWNAVWKDSITTPCRMVVDSRCSGLNEHLAKGHNTLNNLQMLLMRFRSFRHVGSYDISKMYNMLRIEESHLQYQLILWVDDMDSSNETELWVMTRAIYGTISSGNQAEVAIRRGAAALEDKYPEGAFTIIHETYVDDGVPGRDDRDQLKLALEEVGYILERIGFALKCTVVSKQTEPLSKKASKDNISIGIAGYNYKPRIDKIGLAVKECNFNPNIRGAKAPNKHKVEKGDDIDDDIFPTELTRAQVVGKVAELFDLIGIFMPITVEGKIMARKVAHLDWKDKIPEDLLEDWKKFVKKVQDTRLIELDRCIIPEEAVMDKQVDIFEIHDGSQHCSAATIYARTELPDGTFSTRLLFSRSSLCPPNQSIPRNELQSSHLGAVATFITRVALKEKVRHVSSFGDSRVALCWVINPDLKLKNWCLARVQEIHRISGEVDYFWVKGEWNIADLATKGQVTTNDVKNESDWQKGVEWMHLSIDDMRKDELILDFEEVMTKLDAGEQKELGAEQHPTLPDLAAGGRRDANPELDIDVMNITTPSLMSTPIYQLVDLQRPTESLPQLKNIQGSFYCFGTSKVYRNHPPEGSKLTEKHTSYCKSSGRLSFGDSRNKLPLQEKLQEVPEVHSGLVYDISPSEVSSVMINYPANFSLVVGGYCKERLKICGYLVNPIYYGWEKAYRVTSVAVKFTWTVMHRAHQIPDEDHHLFGKLTEKQLKVRRKLKEKCQLCKPVKTEGVNLAYLDAVTMGAASVNRFDQMVREEETKVWKLRYNQTHVTTRAEAKRKKQDEEMVENESGKQSEEWKTIEIEDRVKVATWKYFMKIASGEVTEVLNNKDKKMFSFDKEEKIWKYYGRLLERTDIETRDIELDEFFDSDKISYIQPVGLATSPFVYSLVLDLHWRIFPHKGVQATGRILSQIIHVIKGGHLVRTIREDCQQCRRILKKKMQEKMGDIPLEKLIISPAFYAVQIDHCGPFLAYSRHNFRSTIKIDALVITCINTSAVSICALETLEAPSIIKGLLRHSCRYGYPFVAYIDKGPGLVKACNADFDLSSYSIILKKTCGMRVVAKPTQAHESRGKVERVVQTLKNFLEDRKLSVLKQSILDWETTFLYVSNFINNLPMARLTNNRSMSSDLNEILTPNRLLLGRNNERSPCFLDETVNVGYDDRLVQNTKINRAWFTMLTKLVPTLVFRPKWHDTTECPPAIGDIILFKHLESRAGREHEDWRPGRIYDIVKSESSNTVIYFLEYKILIQKKGQKVEDCKVETHTTSRVLREIVILYTEEELTSPVGSPEHLKKLEQSLLKSKK